MKNINKKDNNPKLLKKTAAFGIILLFTINAIMASENTKATDGVVWDVKLNFKEPGAASDYVVFGETTNANDGPPVDSYDRPKPPAQPTPYIRAWLGDGLAAPYDILQKDYRKYQDTYKAWNLSVQWVPSDYITSTSVTISWDIGEVDDSEYNSVVLYDMEEDLQTNMMTQSSYSFTCPANLPRNFKINCVSSNNPPEHPKKPSGETNGYHGAPYTYNTSSNDPDGDDVYYFFNWSDGTNSGWIGPYGSGELCSTSHTWQTPGTYNITVKAKDNYVESEWSEQLLINMGNRRPFTPSNPSPANKSTGIETNAALSWTGGDPDGDIVTYDIHFGTTSPPPKIVSKQSTTSFNPSLSTKTFYYWMIVAWDNYDESTPGLLWSFTTKESSNGEPGNGQPDGQENIPPTADASASETVGLAGSPLTFDGSQSLDQDGYIKNWSWIFGDGSQDHGEILTHAYANRGTYNVTLTVTDNEDATNKDSFSVFIRIANTPPLNPTIIGQTTGNKNVKYPFTAVTADPDNDSISYTFDWDDGTTNTTIYVPNKTPVTLNHSWASAGIYTIVVTVSDNLTTSGETKLLILIDTQYIGGMGYMLDNDGDGIFDVFRNYTTAIESTVNLKDGNYLIDIDGDGDWDHTYNETTGTITPYTKKTIDEVPWTVIVLIAVALLIISLIVYFYKRGYF
ncbi:MAG: PKD domain-containing protein [Thermoplasmatales archaeon]|nr:MAG: PKD domain-containing protein [Thermoplasmatales archaeon]